MRTKKNFEWLFYNKLLNNHNEIKFEIFGVGEIIFFITVVNK